MDMNESKILRVKAILDAYGANPLHWPEAERAGVAQIVADHPAVFKAELESARWLDGQLDTHRLIEDGAALPIAKGPFSEASIIPFRAKTTAKQLYMAISLAVAASVCGIVFGLSLADNEISQLRRIAVLQEAQLLTSEVDG